MSSIESNTKRPSITSYRVRSLPIDLTLSLTTPRIRIPWSEKADISRFKPMQTGTLVGNLRTIAQVKMGHEQAGQTLQATALVHEAYLRLVGDDDPKWNSRGHFFSATAEAMRRILIDRARRKKREKHGGNLARVPLEDLDVALETNDEQLLEVNDALEKFVLVDPICAVLVKLRFFCGASSSDAAKMVGMSECSARRAWAYARSWLFKEIQRSSTETESTD